MPNVDPSGSALSEPQFLISPRAKHLARTRIVATEFALLLLAGLTVASGQRKKVTVNPRTQHPIYLPDLAIKNGSIRVNPAYSEANAKHTPELYATMVIANVGRGTADLRHYKIYAQVGEPATAVYCWCSKRKPVHVSKLAPGASFTLKLAIYYDPHGEYQCGPHEFEFAVDQEIDPSQHWGHRMNEVTDANNSFGPVYITIPQNLCQPPRLRKPSSLANGVVRSRARSVQAKKLAPSSQTVRPGHPNPAKASPAVHLPSGWTTIGGVLRAGRPGLRLRLSAGHTLISTMGSGGRLSYELLEATGGVVERITAKESVRISRTGELMLETTHGPHRQVLIGRVLNTLKP